MVSIHDTFNKIAILSKKNQMVSGQGTQMVSGQGSQMVSGHGSQMVSGQGSHLSSPLFIPLCVK